MAVHQPFSLWYFVLLSIIFLIVPKCWDSAPGLCYRRTQTDIFVENCYYEIRNFEKDCCATSWKFSREKHLFFFLRNVRKYYFYDNITILCAQCTPNFYSFLFQTDIASMIFSENWKTSLSNIRSSNHELFQV